MKRLALASLAALLGSPVLGEVVPRSGAGDPHIQQVDYDAEQVVALDVLLGFAVTIELSPDERVENIALGNSAAWQVQVNHRGDKLFIKPQSGSVLTNMTVITDARRYNFVLRPGDQHVGIAPYVVRFVFQPLGFSQPPPPVALTRYKLHGKKTLWPTAMSDDGHFTSIVWPIDEKMPATYRVDDRGAEALVNGVVRDGAYVIEGVATKYIFRLDKKTARAVRRIPRKGRQ